MFALVITIHVIACVLLILIVLIQQGKGGGLIDSFSSAESIFGTKTNTFLLKATSVLSVVFFLTCLGLAFLSIQQNKSLIETSYKPPAVTTIPVSPTNATAQQTNLAPISTNVTEQQTAPAAATAQTNQSAPAPTTP